MLAQAERRVPNTRRDRQWAPIFCPRKFITDNNNLDLENFRFSPAILDNYGMAITKLRRGIQKEAMEKADPDLFPNVSP